MKYSSAVYLLKYYYSDTDKKTKGDKTDYANSNNTEYDNIYKTCRLKTVLRKLTLCLLTSDFFAHSNKINVV